MHRRAPVRLVRKALVHLVRGISPAATAQDRTPTGTAKSSPSSKPQVQEPTSPNGQSPQSPGTANRPQPTAGGRSGGAASPPPTQQKHQPGPPISRNTSQRHPPRRNRGRPKVVADSSAKAGALSAGSATTGTAARRPSRERLHASPAASSISADDRDSTSTRTPGPIPVWDPPPPPAPKQSVWGRLGFGRKAEPPEAYPTAPPVQQHPGTPITQPPRTSPSGATPSIAQTGPVAPTGPQAGTPVQQRPVPENEPGSPAGPGLRWPLAWRGSRPQVAPRSLRKRRPVSRASPGTGPAR